MYEAFYRLDRDPFRLSPDHRLCFPHGSYSKARAYLEYGLRRAEGLIAVIGAPGTGKSTLIEDLLASLTPSQTVVARLVSTQLRATDLLRLLAFGFKLPAEGMDKATLLHRVEGYAAAQVAAGRRVLIIVDEAQDLAADALEELRLLTNLQFKGRPLVQVFLLGQDQLHEKLTSPAMEQLRQRLTAVSRLLPMTTEETRAYVIHRLERAGWTGDPEITAEAIELIYWHSGGVPRLVNQTCSRLFLYGAAEQKYRLDGADAELVIRELQDEMPPLHGKTASPPIKRHSETVVKPSSEPRLSSGVSIAHGSRHQGPQHNKPRSSPEFDEAKVVSSVGRAEGKPTRTQPVSVGKTHTKHSEAAQDAQSSRGNPGIERKHRKTFALIVLLLAFVGAGSLGVAALQSEPFGPTLANWSRGVLAETRDIFAGRAPIKPDDVVTGSSVAPTGKSAE